jgi:hypothetical protein
MHIFCLVCITLHMITQVNTGQRLIGHIKSLLHVIEVKKELFRVINLCKQGCSWQSSWIHVVSGQIHFGCYIEKGLGWFTSEFYKHQNDLLDNWVNFSLYFVC